MDSNPERPVLVIIQGDRPGERWELDPTRVTSIGRSSRNQVQLLELSVSRFHCEIAFSNGFWYISDLNSRKGTLLNGKDVETREALQPGDVIRISGNLLRFTDAGELEGIVADTDECGGEYGIDMLQESSVREALEKELIHERGRKFRAVLDWSRGLARSTAVPLLVAALCFAVSATLLSAAHSRARKRREDIERRRARAESDFAMVMQRIESREHELVGYGPILNELESIVREHSRFPEAVSAAEKFVDFEAAYFQKVMDSVHEYVLAGDFDSAAGRLHEADNYIVNSGYARVIQAERIRIERLGAATESEGGTQAGDGEASGMPSEEELLERFRIPPMF